MVFSATFNNISVLSWQSVLLVKETRGRGENHRPVASRYFLSLANAKKLTAKTFLDTILCAKNISIFTINFPFHNIKHANIIWHQINRGQCGHDRMVVGFTNTYAISAYHH
jgi:hypothetical protein